MGGEERKSKRKMKGVRRMSGKRRRELKRQYISVQILMQEYKIPFSFMEINCNVSAEYLAMVWGRRE
jgi:hypothetical protein